MEQELNQELNFEQAMCELESLVKKLEEGRLPLEEAIKAFERGTALKQLCDDKLKSAKMRVEKVMLNKNNQFEGVEEFNS